MRVVAVAVALVLLVSAAVADVLVRKAGRRFACLGLLLAALVTSLLAVGDARAMLAANSQITNYASLSYASGGMTVTSTSEVSIRVALVPSKPLIIPGPPGVIPYNGPGTSLNNTFTVRSSANGPDSYTLATAVIASTSIGLAPRAMSSAGFGRRLTGPTWMPARACSRVSSAGSAR